MLASAAPSRVRIHLYMGPHKGTCGSAVICAVSRLQNRFDDGHSLEIKMKYIDEVRKGSPADLIDWLLDSDIHIIATHVHQGIPRWSASIVYSELQRLRNHCGFPKNSTICMEFDNSLHQPLRYNSRWWKELSMRVEMNG